MHRDGSGWVLKFAAVQRMQRQFGQGLVRARRASVLNVLDHAIHRALPISSQTPPRKTNLQTARLKARAGTTWFRA